MKKIFCLALATLAAFASAFSQTDPEPPAKSHMQVTTRLPGHANPSTISIAVHNGMAVYQDDIILGPVDEVLNPPAQNRGLVMEDLDTRWPGGRIPYEISGIFTAAYRDTILTAVDYMNGSTNLLLVPRGNGDANWVKFVPSDGCRSFIGMRDDYGQDVELKDIVANGNGCGFIQIIHEIAHAAGIWHEQCRADRDQHVIINWSNIKQEDHHNFEKDIDENIEIGDYDFESSMHYFSRAFAINPTLPTITRKNGPVNMKEKMGNTSDFSGGDVWAINWLYPVKNCPVGYTITRPMRPVAQRLLYEAALTINSNTIISGANEITYDAGNAITLQPGFEVVSGSKFRAVIEGCGGQVVPFVSGEADEWYAQTGSFEDRMAENWTDMTPSELTTAASMNLLVAPNPFSGSTTITYTLEAEQQVSMRLMDAIGKLVATPLPAQTQGEGEHQFNLEAGDLPAGLYFLVIKIGEKLETKRLILNR